MASEEEIDRTRAYADKILNRRNEVAKKSEDTQGKIKLILYIIAALVVIGIIVYIIYQAYSVPEPPDILTEIKQFINQIPPKS